jgi:hypothetical protein
VDRVDRWSGPDVFAETMPGDGDAVRQVGVRDSADVRHVLSPRTGLGDEDGVNFERAEPVLGAERVRAVDVVRLGAGIGRVSARCGDAERAEDENDEQQVS